MLTWLCGAGDARVGEDDRGHTDGADDDRGPDDDGSGTDEVGQRTDDDDGQERGQAHEHVEHAEDAAAHVAGQLFLQ